MQDFAEIKSVINTLMVVIDAMKKKRLGGEDIQNVNMTVDEINHILYHAQKLKFQGEYDLEKEEEYLAYVGELESLIALWNQSMQRRRGKAVDIQFWEIYEYFKYVEPNIIYDAVVRHFMTLPEGWRIEYLSLPYRYTFLQNKIDFTKNDFSLIEQHVFMMSEKVEKYKWLYENLADDRSKIVLNAIICYWFTFNVDILQVICGNIFENHYDLSILECGDEDVIVDLGAYTGDSVLEYMDVFGAYKRIYAYEITPSTYETLVSNVSMYPNVVLKQKGVSSKAGTMYVNNVKNGAGNKILESGDTPVEIVTLDEDITEPITVIKMDIEGAEKDAILGGRKHIEEEKPNLLISSYHIPDDIFEIPYLIHGIRDDYKFYLRYNGHGSIWPCDYVLIAV